MSLLSRRKRRKLLDAAHADLNDAHRRLCDLLLSADAEYAGREPDWQEGPEGMRHCTATDTLRRAVLTLRGLDLPEVGDLG